MRTRKAHRLGRFEHLELTDWKHAPSANDEKPAGMLDKDYYVSQAAEAFAEERFEKALGYYSRALQDDITMEAAWLGQLRCLIELGELPEAITWSGRAMEKFPVSADILSARAVAEARQGKFATAMEYSDGAFKAQNVGAYSWVARGEALLGSNATNAKACFAKAIELAPGDWALRSWIGRAYLIRKQYHLAWASFTKAVELDSERFVCWHWIGKCAEAMGRIREAETAYRRALEISPGFRPSQIAMSEISRRGPMSRIASACMRLFGRGSVSEG